MANGFLTKRLIAVETSGEWHPFGSSDYLLSETVLGGVGHTVTYIFDGYYFVPNPPAPPVEMWPHQFPPGMTIGSNIGQNGASPGPLGWPTLITYQGNDLPNCHWDSFALGNFNEGHLLTLPQLDGDKASVLYASQLTASGQQQAAAAAFLKINAANLVLVPVPKGIPDLEFFIEWPDIPPVELGPVTGVHRSFTGPSNSLIEWTLPPGANAAIIEYINPIYGSPITAVGSQAQVSNIGLAEGVNIYSATLYPFNKGPAVVFDAAPPTDLVLPAASTELEIFLSSLSPVQVIGDPSGIYTFVPGKLFDTIYEHFDTPVSSQDVPIPRPHGVLSFKPEGEE